MQRIVNLTPDIAVTGELQPDDLAQVAALGFRSLVNNRPDGEDEGQLPAELARDIATSLGLAYHHLPVRGYDVSDEDVVDAFAKLSAGLKGPVLYYCRSGTRCTLLWAQSAAPRLGVEAVTAIAARAGYDVSVVRDEMEERAAIATQAA